MFLPVTRLSIKMPRISALLFAMGILLAPAALAAQEGAPPGAAPPKARAENRPFELTGVEIAAERDRPQACFAFSRPLPRQRGRTNELARFVSVDPAQGVAITTRDQSLCLDGLKHGQRYAVTINAGLPAAGAKERLAAAITRDLAVPDRKPSLSFRGQGYILPRVEADGLPLRGVNVDRSRLTVLRLNDRALVEQLYYGRSNQTMTEFEIGDVLDQKGERVWRGEMAIAGERNKTTQIAFPIDAVVGDLAPGVYVAVAEDAALSFQAWDKRATQWFVVSDLGLTSFRAANGLYVFARSLSTAKPQAGVELRLVGRDKRELGRAVTGADGLARFDATQISGNNEAAPQALFASTPDGGFSLLDFGAPAVELVGKGDGGRLVAGTADAYLFPERGAYRPGDPVWLTALLRDADAKALAGQKLTFKVVRPDGLEVERRSIDDGGAGVHVWRMELPANAPSGRWTATAHLDPAGPALGQTIFNVGEVAPARISFDLTADRTRIGPDGKVNLSIDARYLNGGAAGLLPGEMTLTLRPTDRPRPGLDGFRFGLVQQSLAPEKRALPGFTTGPDGRATLNLDLGKLPDTTRRLEAVLRTTLHDVGGRSVEQELVLPVEFQPVTLGLKPNFTGDAVPEGATVSVDVVAVSPDGQKVGRSGLTWDLFEEEYDYEWYAADGRWEYRTIVKDRRLTGGNLNITPGQLATIEEQVRAGRYRLELFDPASGVASSLRFSAGWWVSAKLADTPDVVEVKVQEPLHIPGQKVRVFIRPPYAGTVAIALADRAIRHTLISEIGTEGAFVELPLPEDITAGAYVLATSFAPADPGSRTPPRRALGMGWVAIDPAQRSLSVSIAEQPPVHPRGSVKLPVAVAGAEPGSVVRVLVTAVDESMAHLPETQPIDPVGWFLGKRRLAVEMRDVYGRLVNHTEGSAAAPAGNGGDKTGTRISSVRRTGPITALHSGVVTVGPNGQAEVNLLLPDMAGRLALTAVAWSDAKVGVARGTLEVRDDIATDMILPGFLAPGDRARIALNLENLSGPVRGAYKLSMTAEGPVRLEGGKAETSFPALARGRKLSINRTLVAGDPGYGVLVVNVTGPDGYSLTRRFPINIRPAHAVAATQVRGQIMPGQTATLAAPKPVGAIAGASWKLSMVSPHDTLDALTHLLLIDAWPFGSADQIAARLLPLAGANEWQKALGLPANDKLKAKAEDLVERLISRQRADGAFSLWAHDGPADPWLTAFALDVLTRSREAGFTVPEDGYRRGMDWLARSIGNSWVEDAELPARAYGLYVAARARAIDATPLRFFQETFQSRVPSRLARAQIAAAFAMLGDGQRAGDILSRLDDPLPGVPGIRDFGSPLRDRAATLALLIAANADPARIQAEEAALVGMLRDPALVATQERAWLLLAAQALANNPPALNVVVDGQTVTSTGPLLRALADGAALSVTNRGDQPLNSLSTIAGILSTPDKAESAGGLTLSRQFKDGKGRPANLKSIRAGDLLVVVLEGRAEQPLTGPLLLIDPLPAGLVVENVRLAGSAQLGGLSWLGTLSEAALVEFRDDRFVAALDGMPESGSFRLVYLARAVTQGNFTLPAARLDDLIDGSRFARTAAGSLTVLPPAPEPTPPTIPTVP
ncbi:alpha-2-macroglobulin family protein [Niveispirillum lacus]|nr:alpha-2-macroglobulin [Niveispirillum lacus]